ncbi:MAG: histidine--tRNA ligase, partial [Eudoraea sp.]|nr:histidine--tRNA ligase [Eudoraea sp.]
DGVIRELLANGISSNAVDMAMPLFSMSDQKKDPFEVLSSFLKNSEIGKQGIEELQFITRNIERLGLSSAEIMIDVSLARGLNYYTGVIMEVAAPAGVSMGSIGGGGRYDDLTGIFGMKDLSGVGISFGLDRIYLVLEELGLFPETIDQSVQVLFVNFGKKEAMAALPLIRILRKSGIRTDLYPAEAKMQKQFKYANNRNIPYVVLLGKDELEKQTFVVKDMAEGSQKSYSWKEMEQFIEVL